MSHLVEKSTGVVNFPQVPAYSISRRSDLSFRWDPPLGTRELANALGVKYPFEESLEKQMQCAILEFIESEKEAGKHHNDALTTPSPPIYQTNSSSFSIQPTPSEAFAGSLTTWNVATGEPVERKSRRTSYDNKKRRKVATVRKLGACDYHRKQKTECTCRTSEGSQNHHLPASVGQNATQPNPTSFGSLPSPTTSAPFPPEKEQNTLSRISNISPTDQTPPRQFSFMSKTPHSPKLESPGQAMFWDMATPSSYLDAFDASEPTNSASSGTFTSNSRWQQPPPDPEFENWWASQGP